MDKTAVIINTFNEGADLKRTVDNLRENSGGEDLEFVIVADATTDNSLEPFADDPKATVYWFKNREPQGCGKSKDYGIHHLPEGTTFVLHCDAHTAVLRKTVKDLADFGRAMNAIVTPAIGPLRCKHWTGEKCKRPPGAAKRCTQNCPRCEHPDRVPNNCFRGGGFKMTTGGLAVDLTVKAERVKPYQNSTLPSGVDIKFTKSLAVNYSCFGYPVGLLEQFAGWHRFPGTWGNQEAGFSLRAAFTETPILVAQNIIFLHRYRSWNRPDGKAIAPYQIKDCAKGANQRYMDMVCFDDDTIERFWQPLFARMAKGEDRGMKMIDQEDLRKQRQEFLAAKTISDAEFWRRAGIQNPLDYTMNSDAQKGLFVAACGIGDILQAVPAMKALAKVTGKPIDIDLRQAHRKHVGDLFQNEAWFENAYLDGEPDYRMYSHISVMYRAEAPGLIPQGTQIGLPGESWRTRNEVVLSLEAVPWYGGINPSSDLDVREHNWPDLLHELKPIYKEYVAICPGTAGQAPKRYPHWLDLAVELHNRGIPIVWIGTEDDRETACGAERFGIDLFGKTQDIRYAASALRDARLVVSPQNGLSHLACMMGTDTLTLWGPTNLRKNRSWSEREDVIVSKLHCRGCLYGAVHKYDCVEKGGHNPANVPCMRAIDPKKVAARIVAKLHQPAYCRADGETLRRYGQQKAVNLSATSHQAVLQSEFEFGHFLELVRRRDPRRILEIGSWTGGWLLSVAYACAPGVEFTAVDPKPKMATFRKVAKQLEAMGHAVRLIKKSSDEAVAELQGERFDIIHIDGKHTEGQAKTDFDNYHTLCNDLMVLHDTNQRLTKDGKNSHGGEETVRPAWREIRETFDTIEFSQDLTRSRKKQRWGIGVVFMGTPAWSSFPVVAPGVTNSAEPQQPAEKVPQTAESGPKPHRGVQRAIPVPDFATADALTITLYARQQAVALTGKKSAVGQDDTELSQFIDFLRKRSPKKVLEIGTSYGGWLLSICYICEPGSEFVAIDPKPKPEFDKIAECIGMLGHKLRLIRKTSDEALKELKDELFDVIHIDGDREDGQALVDFNNYRTLCRDIIAFHDLNMAVRKGGRVLNPVREIWRKIRQSYPTLEFHRSQRKHKHLGEFGIGVVMLNEEQRHAAFIESLREPTGQERTEPAVLPRAGRALFRSVNGLGNIVQIVPALKLLAEQTGHPVDLDATGYRRPYAMILSGQPFVGKIFTGMQADVPRDDYAIQMQCASSDRKMKILPGQAATWGDSITDTNTVLNARKVDADAEIPSCSLDMAAFPSLAQIDTSLGLEGRLVGMQGEYVAICPGCGAAAKTRRYPHWRAVCEALQAKGWPLVFMGGDNEAKALEDLGLSLCGRTQLEQLPAILKGATLALGIENGLLHVASAVETPTLALYGPTNPAKWMQWSPTARKLGTNRSCAPCWYTKRQHECGQRPAPCMAEITPEAVVETVAGMIDSTAIAEAPKNVLITGCPRSGTTFISECLLAVGADMPHEKQGAQGAVTWREDDPGSGKYGRVIHLVRHPVDVIGSLATISNRNWKKLAIQAGVALTGDKTLDGMACWLGKCRAIDAKADWRVPVEEIRADSKWPELCERIGLDPATPFPAQISRSTNGRDHPTLSWEDLRRVDNDLFAEIAQLAIEYGYRDVPPVSAKPTSAAPVVVEPEPVRLDDICAVLLNYARPKSAAMSLARLMEIGIRHAVVWNNGCDPLPVDPSLNGSIVQIERPMNIGPKAKFMACPGWGGTHILLVDDDMLLTKAGLTALRENGNRFPFVTLIGHIFEPPFDHYRHRQTAVASKVTQPTPVDAPLIGWGSMMTVAAYESIMGSWVWGAQAVLGALHSTDLAVSAAIQDVTGCPPMVVPCLKGYERQRPDECPEKALENQPGIWDAKTAEMKWLVANGWRLVKQAGKTMEGID